MGVMRYSSIVSLLPKAVGKLESSPTDVAK